MSLNHNKNWSKILENTFLQYILSILGRITQKGIRILKEIVSPKILKNQCLIIAKAQITLIYKSAIAIIRTIHSFKGTGAVLCVVIDTNTRP
jgi:hypothetical protein